MPRARSTNCICKIEYRRGIKIERLYWVMTAKLAKPARYLDRLPGTGSSMTEHIPAGSALVENLSAIESPATARDSQSAALDLSDEIVPAIRCRLIRLGTWMMSICTRTWETIQ